VKMDRSSGVGRDTSGNIHQQGEYFGGELCKYSVVELDAVLKYISKIGLRKGNTWFCAIMIRAPCRNLCPTDVWQNLSREIDRENSKGVRSGVLMIMASMRKITE